MKTLDKSLSLYTETFIPKHVHENNPAFISFIKAYYDWAEQEGNLHNTIHEFGQTYDPLFTKEYYEKIKSEYLNILPDEFLIDDLTFLRIARQLYASKGIPESIRFFFKALYNENIEILFPESRSFLANKRKKIFLKTLKKNVLPSELKKFDALKGGFIRQRNGGLAYVEGVVITANPAITEEDYLTNTPYIGEVIITIQISNKKFDDFYIDKETFKCDETGVELINDPNYVNFFVENQLGVVEVINGGIDYQVGDLILLNDVGFTQDGSPIRKRCFAKVGKVDLNGTIERIIFDDPGIGHEEVYYGTITTSGIGTGATIKFTPHAEYNAAQNDLKEYSADDVHKYSIKSGIPVQFWSKLLANTVHPAGVDFDSIFAVVLDSPNLNLKLYKDENFNVNYDDPVHPSSRKYFEILISPTLSPANIQVQNSQALLSFLAFNLSNNFFKLYSLTDSEPNAQFQYVNDNEQQKHYNVSDTTRNISITRFNSFETNKVSDSKFIPVLELSFPVLDSEKLRINYAASASEIDLSVFSKVFETKQFDKSYFQTINTTFTQTLKKQNPTNIAVQSVATFVKANKSNLSGTFLLNPNAQNVMSVYSEVPADNRQYAFGNFNETETYNRSIDDFDSIYVNLQGFVSHYNTSDMYVATTTISNGNSSNVPLSDFTEVPL